ncbi:MAG: hypothetical protein ABEJ65_04745, partial [bacterium]
MTVPVGRQNLLRYINRNLQADPLENQPGYRLDPIRSVTSMNPNKTTRMVGLITLVVVVISLVSTIALGQLIGFVYAGALFFGFAACVGILFWLTIKLFSVYGQAVVDSDGIVFDHNEELTWNQVKELCFSPLLNAVVFETRNGEEYKLTSKVHGIGTLRDHLEENIPDCFESVSDRKINGVHVFPKAPPKSA